MYVCMYCMYLMYVCRLIIAENEKQFLKVTMRREQENMNKLQKAAEGPAHKVVRFSVLVLLCMYECVCTYVCVYVCMYQCELYVHIGNMNVFVYQQLYVCMYICMYVWTKCTLEFKNFYVCMYVCA